jgi:hypothetical protein
MSDFNFYDKVVDDDKKEKLIKNLKEWSDKNYKRLLLHLKNQED